MGNSKYYCWYCEAYHKRNYECVNAIFPKTHLPKTIQSIEIKSEKIDYIDKSGKVKTKQIEEDEEE